MLKNVPTLSFDQDQKIWSLDFRDHGINPKAKKIIKETEPDKLERFLQDYWSSKKSSSSFSFDRNPCVTETNRQKNTKQLKLQIRKMQLLNRNDKIQNDNLLSFLKEHMEKSINQDINVAKTNTNIVMNLNE